MKKLSILMLVVLFARMVYSEDRAFVNKYSEGIFTMSISSQFTKITGSRLEAIKKQMWSGGKDLANNSGLGDPDEISIDFFSAFSTQEESVLITLSSYRSDEIMYYDNMYESNKKKTQWGIDNGEIAKNSKGVSKIKIDGIQSLLMDVEFSSGHRLQTYILYPPTLQKYSFSVGIMYNPGYYPKYQSVINDFIKSIKIQFPTKN